MGADYCRYVFRHRIDFSEKSWLFKQYLVSVWPVVAQSCKPGGYGFDLFWYGHADRVINAAVWQKTAQFRF